MVQHCVAFNCNERKVPGSSTSFFSFPKDPLQRQKWIIAIKGDESKISSNSRVCSKHFTQDCFVQNLQSLCPEIRRIRKLIDNACPTIFNFGANVQRTAKKAISREQVSIASTSTVAAPFTPEASSYRIHAGDKIPSSKKIPGLLYIGDFKNKHLTSPTGMKHVTFKSREQDSIASSSTESTLKIPVNCIHANDKIPSTNEIPWMSYTGDYKNEHLISIETNKAILKSRGKVVTSSDSTITASDTLEAPVNRMQLDDEIQSSKKNHWLYIEDFKKEQPTSPSETKEDIFKFQNHVSPSSTSTVSDSETVDAPVDCMQLDEEIPTSKRNPRLSYIGDFKNEHLTSPTNMKKAILKSRDTILQQRKKIKHLQQQNRRLLKRLTSASELITHLKQKLSTNETSYDTLLSTLPAPLSEIVIRNFKNTKEEYSPALRNFALTLNLYSSAAYNYVRETFATCLPHPATLRKW